MSFLDETQDRPSGSGSRRLGGQTPGGGSSMAARRAVGLGVGLLLVLLLGLAARGCLESRKERGYEDYVREVAALVEESNQQGTGFFRLLQDPESQDPLEVENRANEFQLAADQLVERARGADPPDDLARAQRYLLDLLELRRDGIAEIARRLPTALASDGEDVSAQIAANVQHFIASDVLFTRRFIPALERPLAKEGFIDEVPAPERMYFTPDIELLLPDRIADSIRALGGSGGGGSNPDEGPVEPGLHGTELLGVTAEPGGALSADGTTTLEATGDVAFAVEIMNGGEFEEQGIEVTVTLTGGDEPIEVTDTLDSVAAGETATVMIPLASEPPTDVPVTVEVQVAEVGGEENVDNNAGSFPVTFTP